ncbi:MAG: hypothetical protein BGO98_04185 [Myxococcales bacterium 68-20]|nr:MAG: hypothetical protein BGO98_04185 [Myxococcales bacterium 68-20]
MGVARLLVRETARSSLVREIACSVLSMRLRAVARPCPLSLLVRETRARARRCRPSVRPLPRMREDALAPLREIARSRSSVRWPSVRTRSRRSSVRTFPSVVRGGELRPVREDVLSSLVS